MKNVKSFSSRLFKICYTLNDGCVSFGISTQLPPNNYNSFSLVFFRRPFLRWSTSIKKRFVVCNACMHQLWFPLVVQYLILNFTPCHEYIFVPCIRITYYVCILSVECEEFWILYFVCEIGTVNLWERCRIRRICTYGEPRKKEMRFFSTDRRIYINTYFAYGNVIWFWLDFHHDAVQHDIFPLQFSHLPVWFCSCCCSQSSVTKQAQQALRHCLRWHFVDINGDDWWYCVSWAGE